jgi:hypothetical protein
MSRSLLLALALMSIPTLASAAGPDAGRVAQVIESLRTCQVDDVRDLLDAEAVHQLEILGTVARHVELDWSSESINMTRVMRRLRANAEAPTLESVFAAYCQVNLAERSRLLLTGFSAGRSFLAPSLAWVALVDQGRHYYGTGLTLVEEDRVWRLSLRRWEEMDLIYAPPQVPGFTQAWEAATGYYDPYMIDDDAVACPVPAAPEPRPELGEDLDDTYYGGSDEPALPGPRHQVSVLERQAVEFYASGREAAPSAVAEALQAEVLIRSAFFQNAPPPGSDAWLAQIDRAFELLRAAHARGLSMARVGPLLTWLGELYLAPEFARAADLAKARVAFELAAANADLPGTLWLAKFLAYGLDGAAPQCHQAQALLQPFAADQDHEDDQASARLASAWIALECADPAARDLAQSQALAAQLHATELWDRDEIAQLGLLDAALACAMAAPSTDWRSSCPTRPEHDALEFQAERTLTQLFRPNKVAIPDQFKRAPPPSGNGDFHRVELPLRCD